MNFITTVKNSSIANKIRTITAILFGTEDNKSAGESSPAGYDGAPIANLQAVYIKTAHKKQPVFIGYINKNQVAQPGEARMYATDAGGTVQCYTYLHNDGKVEVVRGNTKITLTDAGVKIEANGENLGDTLKDVVQQLITPLNVLTPTGNGQFTPDVVVALTEDLVKLNAILV